MTIRVRFHGRGGQGAKTASRILGNAAFNGGFFVQDFPIYGAERRGAPVTSFTRFSQEVITERGFIFSPDVIAVMDDSLLSDPVANPYSGLRKGGLAVVNTTKPVSEVNGGRADITVLTLDLTKQALSILGKAVLSAGIAAAVARATGIAAKAFMDGLVEELKDLGLSDEVVRKNTDLAAVIYDEVEPMQLRTEELPSKASLVPLAVVVSGGGSEDVLNPGNSASRHTGNWRLTRPVIDYQRCTDCLICYAYCPESAMSVGPDGRVSIDYDNCKGCMICQVECPLRAIGEGKEGLA